MSLIIIILGVLIQWPLPFECNRSCSITGARRTKRRRKKTKLLLIVHTHSVCVDSLQVIYVQNDEHAKRQFRLFQMLYTQNKSDRRIKGFGNFIYSCEFVIQCSWQFTIQTMDPFWLAPKP